MYKEWFYANFVPIELTRGLPYNFVLNSTRERFDHDLHIRTEEMD
jgi:hypothetical protein